MNPYLQEIMQDRKDTKRLLSAYKVLLTHMRKDEHCPRKQLTSHYLEVRQLRSDLALLERELDIYWRALD